MLSPGDKLVDKSMYSAGLSCMQPRSMHRNLKKDIYPCVLLFFVYRRRETSDIGHVHSEGASLELKLANRTRG